MTLKSSDIFKNLSVEYTENKKKEDVQRMLAAIKLSINDKLRKSFIKKFREGMSLIFIYL